MRVEKTGRIEIPVSEDLDLVPVLEFPLGIRLQIVESGKTEGEFEGDASDAAEAISVTFFFILAGPTGFFAAAKPLASIFSKE
jgi:hypothetical protein